MEAMVLLSILYRGAGLLVHSCGRTPGTPTPGLGPNMEGRTGRMPRWPGGATPWEAAARLLGVALGLARLVGTYCGASSGRRLPPSFRDASGDFQTAVPASPSGRRRRARPSPSEERCSLMTFPRFPYGLCVAALPRPGPPKTSSLAARVF